MKYLIILITFFLVSCSSSVDYTQYDSEIRSLKTKNKNTILYPRGTFVHIKTSLNPDRVYMIDENRCYQNSTICVVAYFKDSGKFTGIERSSVYKDLLIKAE